jgi:hypothetical protein
MKRAFILLFILPSMAFAQLFKLNNSNKPSSFNQLQTEFEEYRQQNDLKTTRGWKWYKRWEAHYEQRQSLHGNMVDPSVFFEEAKKYRPKRT